MQCGMVLTFKAYNEVVEEKKTNDARIEALEQFIQSLIDSGQLKPVKN
jgi:hypothetical protein